MALTGNVTTPFTVSIVMASEVPTGDDHTVVFSGPQAHPEDLLIQSNQTMTFTNANWSTPQLVTVKAQVEGTVYLNYRITAPHTSRVRTGSIALTISVIQPSSATMAGTAWGVLCTVGPPAFTESSILNCPDAVNPGYVCTADFVNTDTGGSNYPVYYRVWKDGVLVSGGGFTSFTATSQWSIASSIALWGLGVYAIHFYFAEWVQTGAGADKESTFPDEVTVADTQGTSVFELDRSLVTVAPICTCFP
jgi:hypothetical protein